MASKTYQCFTCGAELKWSPASQCWQCEYCDSQFQESDFKDAATETPADSRHEAQAVEHEGNMAGYKCSYCGAEVVTTQETAATFCVYCQRPVILANNLSGEFHPDWVLPFKNTKQDALDAYKKYIKGKPFLPKDFIREETLQKITGVYIPFWLVDADIGFYVSGEGDRVTTWSDQNYRYTKTDTYQVNRRGSISFKNVPSDASQKTDDRIMESIEPFDFRQMVPFKMPYLSGFLAEKYDVPLEQVLPKINNRCYSTTHNNIASTLTGYHSVRKAVDETTITGSTSKYVLLPVWLMYTQYKGQSYIFAMNGQSGKLVGNSPIDTGKAIRFGVLTFLCGVGISLLAQMLLGLGGVL